MLCKKRYLQECLSAVIGQKQAKICHEIYRRNPKYFFTRQHTWHRFNFDQKLWLTDWLIESVAYRLYINPWYCDYLLSHVEADNMASTYFEFPNGHRIPGIQTQDLLISRPTLYHWANSYYRTPLYRTFWVW